MVADFAAAYTVQRDRIPAASCTHSFHSSLYNLKIWKCCSNCRTQIDLHELVLISKTYNKTVIEGMIYDSLYPTVVLSREIIPER